MNEWYALVKKGHNGLFTTLQTTYVFNDPLALEVVVIYKGTFEEVDIKAREFMEGNREKVNNFTRINS
mgnify:CR=1 FL=1